MIDTHIHADSRSGEDFRDMYLAGIDSAITCSYYPYKIDSELILLNHLNRILELDTKRASEHGLDLKVALGIHPTNCIKNPEMIYDKLYEWVENKQIVAIGEIGLEDLSDIEIETFKKQLDIADKTNSKVIIHTPRKNKKEGAIDILDNYGFDRFFLNSDMSNKPSDPLSVAKTIRELTRLAYNKNDIEKISHKNAADYFKI